MKRSRTPNTASARSVENVADFEAHDLPHAARGAAIAFLVIRGTGREPQTDAISFEAVAMPWYDPQQGRVRMRRAR